MDEIICEDGWSLSINLAWLDRYGILKISSRQGSIIENIRVIKTAYEMR
jgi:hypothetical protein